VSSVEWFSIVFIARGNIVPPRPPSFGLTAYLSEYSHSYIEITNFFQLELSIELDRARGRPPRTSLGARR
jgi:hypothetical protein